MDIIVTGAYGRVGTALLDNHSDCFNYIPFDRKDHPDIKTVVGDASKYQNLKKAFRNKDGVVHLAADPNVDARFESILQNNVIGAYNCLEACKEQEIETAILASSNHVVGMYEEEYSPEIYHKNHNILLDHHTPVRPDSLYGTSKVFLEALGRYYVENYEYPSQVYALRIGSVRYPKYDHPFGDAEAGVEKGVWKRGSEQYWQEVRRMKATWHSRRDVASLIECCLVDETATFEIFYGVSNNDRRWFDIERPREVVGYEPQDNGEDWERPPEETGDVDSTVIEQR